MFFDMLNWKTKFKAEIISFNNTNVGRDKNCTNNETAGEHPCKKNACRYLHF